ncbi:MAG: hypothetical protein V5B33_18380 [Candidatus Accumulibacter sp. UW20]|jgi:hypothetical protein
MDKNGEREAYWRGHVAEWRASGESQRAYCDRHGLKDHSLSYWHQRLAKREGGAAVGEPLTLIRATIVADPLVSMPCLSLASPNGWRLEFGLLPPAEWLVALWANHS